MPRFSNKDYVPAKDSSDNVDIADVVGNKTDGHNGDSLLALAHTNEEHNHAAAQVYPTLAAGATVTSDAVAWTLGTLVEVVPASTITEDFDIHAIDIEAISANDTFELVLYYGAGDTEAGRIRFVRSTVQSATLNTEIQTPLIPANSRVRAAVACAGGGSKTVDVSLRYHTY
jgi:hypothetical protein